MSSVAVPVTPDVSEQAPKPKIPWITLAWFCALLIVCYAPVLWALGKQWNNDEDMGHGFFVPVIAAYIAWQNRDKVAAAEITRVSCRYR